MTALLRWKNLSTRVRSGASFSEEDSPEKRPHKIVLLGARGVGKSAILVRLLTRRFIGDYAVNLETAQSYSTVVDDNPVGAYIFDTSGTDLLVFMLCEAHSSRVIMLISTQPSPGTPTLFFKKSDDKLSAIFSWADIILLVYSIVDRDSFAEVRRLKELLDNHPQNSTKQIVIVGNKADLSKSGRAVRPAEAVSLAAQCGCPTVDISARESHDSVNAVFHLALRMSVRCRLVCEKTQLAANGKPRKGADSFMTSMNEYLTKTRPMLLEREMLELSISSDENDRSS